jgi:hypothetical protein
VSVIIPAWLVVRDLALPQGRSANTSRILRTVVDNNIENRYAIGSLCIDLYLGMNLLRDIRALEGVLERDRKV